MQHRAGERWWARRLRAFAHPTAPPLMSNSSKPPAEPRARGFAISFRPRKTKRAQGKPGALSTRDRAHKVHTGDRKVRRNTRPSLRNGFTAYSALSPATGFLATVAPRISPRSLTPASGRQDHTTSPSASACVRLSQTPRPPHPTARFVTCATPLSSGETGRASSPDLPDALSKIFFREGLDRFF
jgi:hypothetical protein